MSLPPPVLSALEKGKELVDPAVELLVAKVMLLDPEPAASAAGVVVAVELLDL